MRSENESGRSTVEWSAPPLISHISLLTYSGVTYPLAKEK